MKYLTAFLMVASVALAERRDGPRLPSAMTVMVEENGRIVCSSPDPDMVEDLEAHLVSHQISDSQFSWQISYSHSENAGIQLQFRDVPEGAKEAIRHAAAIWEDHLVIDVPFTLRFHWEKVNWRAAAFVSGTWEDGEAGSFSCLSRIEQRCIPNTLANQVLGRRVKGQSSDPEFEIHINKDSIWYLGTDGKGPTEQRDLVSTILHEIGHAVGFFSGAIYDTNQRVAQLRLVGGYVELWTLFYDEFLWHPDKRTQRTLAGPSRELFEALTETRLMWGREGDQGFREGGFPSLEGRRLKTLEVNEGPVLLWTSKENPNQGMHHLDDYLFPGYRADGLMTPTGNDAEILLHDIGPVTLAILYDLGWEIRNPPWEEEAEEETTTREPGEGGIRQRPVRRR